MRELCVGSDMNGQRGVFSHRHHSSSEMRSAIHSTARLLYWEKEEGRRRWVSEFTPGISSILFYFCGRMLCLFSSQLMFTFAYPVSPSFILPSLFTHYFAWWWDVLSWISSPVSVLLLSVCFMWNIMWGQTSFWIPASVLLSVLLMGAVSGSCRGIQCCKTKPVHQINAWTLTTQLAKDRLCVLWRKKIIVDSLLCYQVRYACLSCGLVESSCPWWLLTKFIQLGRRRFKSVCVSHLNTAEQAAHHHHHQLQDIMSLTLSSCAGMSVELLPTCSPWCSNHDCAQCCLNNYTFPEQVRFYDQRVHRHLVRGDRSVRPRLWFHLIFKWKQPIHICSIMLNKSANEHWLSPAAFDNDRWWKGYLISSPFFHLKLLHTQVKLKEFPSCSDSAWGVN